MHSEVSSFREAEACIQRLHDRMAHPFSQSTLIAYLIKCLWKQVDDAVSAHLENSNLNPTSFFALMMLYGSPNEKGSPSELSRLSGETRTNMTRICADLERRGLIFRKQSRADRRRIDLQLAPLGRNQVECNAPSIRAHMFDALSFLDGQELAALEMLLKKLLEAFSTAEPSSEGQE